MTHRPVPLPSLPKRLEGVLDEGEQVFKVVRPDGTVMFFQGLIVVPIYLGVLIVAIVGIVALGLYRPEFAAWWRDLASATFGWLLWLAAAVVLLMLVAWVPYYYLAGFRRTLFVVTSKRVLSMGGFTGLRFRYIPLERVAQVQVVRGFVDDLLDQGTGTIVASGQGAARVDLGPLRNPQVMKEYVDALAGHGEVRTMEDYLEPDEARGATQGT